MRNPSTKDRCLPDANKDVSLEERLKVIDNYQKQFSEITRTPTEWESFLGRNKTDQWQNEVAILRQEALIAVEKSLKELNNPEDKLTLINEALDKPLFTKHRSNYFFTGKFGDTASVSKLKTWRKEVDEELERQQDTNLKCHLKN